MSLFIEERHKLQNMCQSDSRCKMYLNAYMLLTIRKHTLARHIKMCSSDDNDSQAAGNDEGAQTSDSVRRMIISSTDSIGAEPICHPVQLLLPNVVSWPRFASESFFHEVNSKYFSTTSDLNWFHYCILVHKADDPRSAIETLQQEGAFATHVRRSTLIGIVQEARNTPWCRSDVLDAVDKYAKYAFVLEGSDITCGSLPGTSDNGIISLHHHHSDAHLNSSGGGHTVII